MLKKFLSALLTVAIVLSLITAAEAARFGDNYSLQKILILSRHNLRSPHVKESKPLTPHKWFKWTSGSRELSLRGGLIETELGQYFRKYLVAENFMPENYIPAEGEFVFHANSHQRTVATTQYFSSGLLPVANVRVEYNGVIEKDRDPAFNTRLTVLNDKLRGEYERRLLAYCGDPTQLDKRFSSEFALIEKVLDFKNSPAARNAGRTKFTTDDAKFVLERGKQPTVSGSFSEPYEAADALILQYYETGTAFGRKLSDQQWRQINNIIAFNAGFVGIEGIALNIAQPLLVCMNDELNNDARKFTFLCGHDTNIISVTSALGVEDYSLPETIEPRAPIGSKFVIEKWRGADGQDYAAISLVYPSANQIRNFETLDLDNPPKIFPLRLKGLQANADGLYRFSDVQARFAEVIAQYDSLRRS